MITAVFFCMAEAGHYQRCRAVIEELVRCGIEVVAFTDRAQAADVTGARGARFADLFANRRLDALGDPSYPPTVGYVTWAAHHAEAVLEEVRSLRPQLVVTDSFAVIGRVVAEVLGLPHVSIRAGHNVLFETIYPQLDGNPVVRVSDMCLAAVDRLREEYGLEDASPFCYLAPTSPDLNICCEPPEFLTEAERDRLEPVAFFGSLPRSASLPADFNGGEFPRAASRRIYLAFGSYQLQFFPRVVSEAMQPVARAIASTPGAAGLISLSGATVSPSLVAGLQATGVRVEPRVNQWHVLSQADVFITHNGLNSTHEAVFHEVPMLSYPIVADQPAMAARCQELDLALTLSDERLAPLSPETVLHALARLDGERERFRAGLAAARRWEEEVIARRGEVIARIAQLAS